MDLGSDDSMDDDAVDDDNRMDDNTTENTQDTMDNTTADNTLDDRTGNTSGDMSGDHMDDTVDENTMDEMTDDETMDEEAEIMCSQLLNSPSGGVSDEVGDAINTSEQNNSNGDVDVVSCEENNGDHSNILVQKVTACDESLRKPDEEDEGGCVDQTISVGKLTNEEAGAADEAEDESMEIAERRVTRSRLSISQSNNNSDDDNNKNNKSSIVTELTGVKTESAGERNDGSDKEEMDGGATRKGFVNAKPKYLNSKKKKGSKIYRVVTRSKIYPRRTREKFGVKSRNSEPTSKVETKYSCQRCKQTYNSKYYLQQHICKPKKKITEKQQQKNQKQQKPEEQNEEEEDEEDEDEMDRQPLAFVKQELKRISSEKKQRNGNILSSKKECHEPSVVGTSSQSAVATGVVLEMCNEKLELDSEIQVVVENGEPRVDRVTEVEESQTEDIKLGGNVYALCDVKHKGRVKMRCNKCNRVYYKKYIDKHVCGNRWSRESRMTRANINKSSDKKDNEETPSRQNRENLASGGSFNKSSGTEDIPESQNRESCMNSGSFDKSSDKEETPRSRKYSCDLCGRHFAWFIDLKQHTMRVHQPAKPLTCNICNKPFTRSYLKLKHEKECAGNRDLLSCRFCERKCKSRIELMRHEDFYHAKGFGRYPRRASLGAATPQDSRSVPTGLAGDDAMIGGDDWWR